MSVKILCNICLDVYPLSGMLFQQCGELCLPNSDGNCILTARHERLIIRPFRIAQVTECAWNAREM